MGGIHPFDAVTERAAGIVGCASRGSREPKGAALPVVVERRLVGLDVDRTEAVETAEVMDAVHSISLAQPPPKRCRRPGPLRSSRW